MNHLTKLLALATFTASGPLAAQTQDLSPLEDLGRALFFDVDLSVGRNQSCASCHDPAFGFTSPVAETNRTHGVVEGSVSGRFGNRRPPSAAYVSPGPVFHHTWDDGDILFVGGAFLDGRATGHQLGTVTADQALGPFLNPVEMGLPHAACVVMRACEADYADQFTTLAGTAICTIDWPHSLAAACETPEAEIVLDEETAASTDAAMAAIARAIATYEASPEVNRFSSRFDRYLAGETEALSELERTGLDIFDTKGECSACHVLSKGPRGEPPLFTDFTYDNLGVPPNPSLPWYNQTAFNPDGADWRDPGLADFLSKDPIYAPFAADLRGAHKVPTLRNLTKGATEQNPRAYMHNGYFKTLEGVVHFYNTRDTLPACNSAATEAEAMAAGCWPAPEIAETMNTDELGDLKLTPEEEAALVAFLRTLDDE